MNILKLLAVLVIILTNTACSTTSTKDYAQALFERQMEDGKDCSPKQTCLRDVLVLDPDLSNHKTKAAYDKEHKVVMGVINDVNACKAGNLAWNDHGFPSSDNCSELAEEKRLKAIGKGEVPKSTGLNVGVDRYNYSNSSVSIFGRARPLVYVYSPYRYGSVYGSYYPTYYRNRNYYTHRDYSSHRPLSVSSEFSHGRERMHRDFKNAHK